MLIKEGLPCIEAILPTQSGTRVAAKIFTDNRTITICSLNLPPNYDNNNMQTQLNLLLTSMTRPFNITAVRNGHHYNWGSYYCDQRGRLIDQWITDNNLSLINTGEPTFIHSNCNLTHIDLAVTSNDIAPLLTWNPLPDAYTSDHFPITIASTLTCPEIEGPPRWLLKSANWDKFKKNLKLPKQKEFISPD